MATVTPSARRTKPNKPKKQPGHKGQTLHSTRQNHHAKQAPGDAPGSREAAAAAVSLSIHEVLLVPVYAELPTENVEQWDTRKNDQALQRTAVTLLRSGLIPFAERTENETPLTYSLRCYDAFQEKINHPPTPLPFDVSIARTSTLDIHDDIDSESEEELSKLDPHDLMLELLPSETATIFDASGLYRLMGTLKYLPGLIPPEGEGWEGYDISLALAVHEFIGNTSAEFIPILTPGNAADLVHGNVLSWDEDDQLDQIRWQMSEERVVPMDDPSLTDEAVQEYAEQNSLLTSRVLYKRLGLPVSNKAQRTYSQNLPNFTGILDSLLRQRQQLGPEERRQILGLMRRLREYQRVTDEWRSSLPKENSILMQRSGSGFIPHPIVLEQQMDNPWGHIPLNGYPQNLPYLSELYSDAHQYHMQTSSITLPTAHLVLSGPDEQVKRSFELMREGYMRTRDLVHYIDAELSATPEELRDHLPEWPE